MDPALRVRGVPAALPVGQVNAWHGRRGSVALGPTQHRVARYLDALTTHGRVSIRTVDLAEACQLERSEAFRVMARLRVLGLFGIANDRGGARGGRLVWRTRIAHDGPGLDPVKHRHAWSRLVAWSRARRARLHSAIDHTRQAVRPRGPLATGAVGVMTHGAGQTFAQLVAPALGAWFTQRT